MNNPQRAVGVIVFALFTVLAMLKLAHVITWSWWWVTAPLWGSLALLILLFLLFVVAVAAAVHEGKPI